MELQKISQTRQDETRTKNRTRQIQLELRQEELIQTQTQLTSHDMVKNRFKEFLSALFLFLKLSRRSLNLGV